jgi:L-serine/L-threonine ammonia-lyase
LHAAVQAKQRVALQQITSLATSLGAKQVCQRAYDALAEHPIQSVLVSDRAAVAACTRFLDDQRLLVEPACGAALALAYEERAELKNFKSVLFIVCGGVTASAQQLEQWSRQFAASV